MSESVIADEARGGRVERLRSRVLHPHHPSRQFVRFLLVGLGNTAISLVVYRSLLELGTPYVVAAPIAFACGATNGYICNRRWTFSAPDTTRARLLYFAISAVGAATLTLLVAVFVRDAGLDKVEAYVAAIPPITVSTFVANRLWTFAAVRERT